MKRVLWFAAFALLALMGIIGLSLSPEILNRWVRRDVVVAVGEKAITKTDLQEALRATLWRQGKAWDELDSAEQSAVRDEALEDLITTLLVRHYRTRSAPTSADEARVQSELTMWWKQFQQAAEGEQRLALQQMTPASMEAGIREQQLDQAWLEQQVSSSAVTVSAAEAKTWYDEHRETLRIPQAHRAAHIYLTRHDKAKPDREAEIRALHQQLMTGKATFAELAAQFSDDDRTKARGGDLNWFTAERMPADFIAAVEALKVGQTSAPVLTALGWHIIVVTDRRPSAIPPFEAVKAEIEATLQSQKRAGAVARLLQNLRQRAEWEGLLRRRADLIAGSPGGEQRRRPLIPRQAPPPVLDKAGARL